MDNRVEDMTLSLYGTVPDSIVDGPGLRYAVFVQGCSHGCPGCHNPESQPAEGGTVTRLGDLLADIRANGLVHNVTLSGGEPFEQPEACAALAVELKREGYGIWCYTGYLYEDLAARAEEAQQQLAKLGGTTSKPEEAAPEAEEAIPELGESLAYELGIAHLLENIDVLVDGPFVESLRSLELKWCGSSNQRLIDMPATRRSGTITLWRPTTFSLEKPANW